MFVYNGEELGLPNVDLPDEVLQDPTWERSGHEERGRDGCRVPMPWEGDTPPFGFSTNPDTWLPMPAEWASLTVDKQRADPESTLAFFRRAVGLRKQTTYFGGTDITWLDTDDESLVFRTTGGLTCALNTGSVPVALPAGEVLLSSGPLTGGELPPDTAVWLA